MSCCCVMKTVIARYCLLRFDPVKRFMQSSLKLNQHPILVFPHCDNFDILIFCMLCELCDLEKMQ